MATSSSTALSMEELKQRISALEKKAAGNERRPVPRHCQTSLRRILKQLLTDVDNPLILTYTSKDDDRDAMLRTVKETRMSYADQGWSVGTCEEAFWKVWTNKKIERRRAEDGLAEQHKLRAKSNKRRNTKLQNRQKSLQTINWVEKKKKKVQEVLTKALTSPVVSDEEDEDVLRSVPFHWESVRFAKYKEHLDEERERTTTRRHNTKKWLRHPTRIEEADVPEGTPEWAYVDLDNSQC